jgi:hypothetical protein
MRKGSAYKTFIYFLCFSFVLLTSGLPRAAAEATESGLPTGEIISSGEVRFEARENVWKRVEPSHFPVFLGVRIKTEKGQALVVLTDESQVEVGPHSLFSLQPNSQFHLFQGRVSFRIPSGVDISFRVGKLSIKKPRRMQAARGLVIAPKNEETIGSVIIRPNGAVTVKSIQGPLSVQNQESVVLAALSSNESVTIPSATAFEGEGEMVAQVYDVVSEMYPTGKAATDELLGLSNTTWMFIALGAVAAAGAGIYLGVTKDDDDEFLVPICP